MESSGNGRGGSFLGGSQAGVRQPEFHTQQTTHAGSFVPTSILDKSQVVRGANGRSEVDRSRQMVTGQSRTMNGESSSTFDDHLWIGNKSRTFG